MEKQHIKEIHGGSCEAHLYYEYEHKAAHYKHSDNRSPNSCWTPI